VPEHLHTITPRLVVRDGAAALAFYRDAFGAVEIGDRFTGPSGELILAEVRIGDSVVMITDEAGDGAPASSPESLDGVVSAIMLRTGRTSMWFGGGPSRRAQRWSIR
jgi:uncharacterized glyoxalase superfamily protein PhnB